MGDPLPNQLVLKPDHAIAIPAEHPDFCAVEFDVRIESGSNDSTPSLIEEAAGFAGATSDAICNTTPPTVARHETSAQICLAPGCRTTSTACEPRASLTYPTKPTFVEIGDIVRPVIRLGANHVTTQPRSS